LPAQDRDREGDEDGDDVSPDVRSGDMPLVERSGGYQPRAAMRAAAQGLPCLWHRTTTA
jgi:hypothetical protein